MKKDSKKLNSTSTEEVKKEVKKLSIKKMVSLKGGRSRRGGRRGRPSNWS
ncbi:MAG: hypothetical protein AAGD05_09275 [Bacteroidota bacterium]